MEFEKFFDRMEDLYERKSNSGQLKSLGMVGKSAVSGKAWDGRGNIPYRKNYAFLS